MSKTVLKYLVCLVLLPGVLSAQSAFYSRGVIQKIEVHFSQSNWDYMLDTARYGKDTHLMAQWVKVNGVYFDSVGVKYKGSSSYDSTYAKNPVHIELNTFKEQNYQGFSDIKLNNNYADPSMVREVMAYEIARTYMDAPQANFAQLYINGKYIGLYTNAEAINKTFLANHFYGNSGTFVKCNPNLTPSPNVKSNLKYIANADSSAYFNYYELKSDYGWNNLKALCDSVTNKASNMASIVDVDRLIWMLAFNSVLVNLDSYNGVFAQNYYLYKDNTSRFCPITWDLNMSFAGFPFVGNSNSSLASLSIASAQTLAINSHSNDAYWPLIVAIQNNATYKRMYVAHLKTIVNEMFSSGNYLTKYNTYKNVIDTAVQSDTRKFYSYTQFQNALTNNYSVGSYSVPGIQTLMDARVLYLQATSDFTNAAPVISQVQAGALQPNANVNITASVSSSGATSVFLRYRFSKAEKFINLQMFDDGAHNDGAAGDNVYGANFNLSANTAQYYLYAENAQAGKFSPERAEHEFYELNVFPQPLPGQVVINEFLADNKSDVKNEYHLNEDWVELYNSSTSTLSLGGYFLSDDESFKPKYSFPLSSTIAPHGYLMVWTDNILLNNSKQLHANFKLNNNNGAIFLSNGAYNTLDSYAYGLQETDVSLGRCPDGYGEFTSFKYPTFNMSNCLVGLDEQKLSSQLNLFPNPATQCFNLVCDQNGKNTLIVRNLIGQKIIETNFENEIKVDCANWPSGIYIVNCGKASAKLIITN